MPPLHGVADHAGACYGRSWKSGRGHSSWIFSRHANQASAVGAGFGWYSLSGVILSNIYSVETRALAFMTNIIRELISFILIPILAVRIGNLAAVAPGGATTMDTTLPLIARATDADTAVIALVNGTTLSVMVPLLVPLLIGL